MAAAAIAAAAPQPRAMMMSKTGVVASSMPQQQPHAVSRSAELLSCAKTAIKVAKSRYDKQPESIRAESWFFQDPQHLCLAQNNTILTSTSYLQGLCEDGLSLLRGMELELSQLEGLVRRRGHTNDPTEEIASSVTRLEADAKELATMVQSSFRPPPGSSTQCQKHWQWIAKWLESVAAQQTTKLKHILKVRGEVLADQAQRRRLLNPQEQTNHSKGPPHRPRPPVMDSPLFTMTSNNRSAATKTTTAYQKSTYGRSTSEPTVQRTNSTASSTSGPTVQRTNSTASTSSAYGSATNGGYGGYYNTNNHTAGYGGSSTATFTTGMRQRRTTTTQSNNPEHLEMQQLQEQQQRRQTERRLEDARETEKTLVELGGLFSKMTNLIGQQGELLEKVEDDVESGLEMITAGHEEVLTVFSIKRGNRALILKVFALLIFLIIFMRFYARK